MSFVILGPDESLDEDIVLPAATDGHAQPDAALTQNGNDALRRKLRALVAEEGPDGHGCDISPPALSGAAQHCRCLTGTCRQ